MATTLATHTSLTTPLTADADERYHAAEILRRLSRIEILRALPAEEIQALVPRVQLMIYPASAVIMEEGAQGDALYLIESGTARVERAGVAQVWHVSPGSVIGEGALLTGEPRNATVTAETDLRVWRVDRQAFDEVVRHSPTLLRSLERLVEQRKQGVTPSMPSTQYWVATALRALEARYRGLTAWQLVMGVGLALWVGLFLNERNDWLDPADFGLAIAGFQLVCGVLIIQGACEALLIGVERLGARRHWDGFVSGTVGSLLSTFPEAVVIAFLVRVAPLAAFVTAAVTIFNNALAFSVYSFFLPKDRKGAYSMPRSLTEAGGEILISGAAVSLIVGLVMLVMKLGGAKQSLEGFDLIGIAAVLLLIYGYYMATLMQYYGEGKDDRESLPPEPGRLGHATGGFAIGSMFALGMLGAYTGGEAIGGFAETAFERLELPIIPTSAGLAFFAGMSEYVIVFKSHRRGELGVALSNVFGGLTQVMFLLLPFAMLAIGLLGLLSGNADYAVPINFATLLLMLLLFPLFYSLHQHMEQSKSLSNLDAAGMTGIYLLLLYFLFTAPV